MMKDKIKWTYFDMHLEHAREGCYGFIYKITFKGGDYYIGKRKFSYGWQSYKSSSDFVKKRIKAGENIRKKFCVWY